MKPVTLLAIIFLISACGTKSRAEKNNPSVLRTEKKNDRPLPANILMVDENCAIILWPDSVELDEIKKENGEEDYYIIMDDMAWYKGIAAETLDSLKIKNIGCKKEIMVFINKQGKETRLKRKDLDGDLVFFRTDKEPLVTNTMVLTAEETQKYFEREVKP